MDRLRLAAMALCCCIALSAAAGRSLQQSWDQALKQSLQAIDQAAGHVFSQVAMTAAASSVVDKSVPLQNKAIDDINERPCSRQTWATSSVHRCALTIVQDNYQTGCCA